ncbi:hypothetical protein KAMAJI_00130 [Serratia phage vB_SmaM-Kamaji]|nr:hypothetical protein KAMAJI_00130 [Serratia phage vB_SmaM-Kamaji]
MKISTEYDEEYMKSMMYHMTEKELAAVIALAESCYIPEDLALMQADAREVIRIRESIDRRLAEYRDNA